MPSTKTFDYRKIIDSFKAGRLSETDIEKRLSDLMLLFDFSASLNQTAGTSVIANLLLLTLMGYTASRRSVFLLQTKKGLELIEAKGFRSKPLRTEWAYFLPPPYPECFLCGERGVRGEWEELCETLDVQLLVPVQQENRLLAVVGLGQKTRSRTYAPHELQMITSVIQLCAGVLENSLTNQTLETLNRQLTLKIYQLNTLFELSKDFHSAWDSDAIFRILGSSLIGQLLVSRCAAFTVANGEMRLQFLRGSRFSAESLEGLRSLNLPALMEETKGPLLCAELASHALQEFCLSNKFHLIYPIVMNDEVRGILFLGEKRNRRPFTREDYDLITALGNLALVADENARMQHAMIEKERLERELAIAREIQVTLLPHLTPEIRGYEITSVFQPCYSVAGDYFDFLPVSDRELSLAIGDVSGKGTPAALIMASLQASLRALTSLQITDPQITIQKLNHLLCESQSKKYVTFFYGVLDFYDHQLTYVNAGHCYPLVLKRNGHVDRLETGGTVLGFFKDAVYKRGTYCLEPGDSMILYTDGVSELSDPNEQEFGFERIIQVLQMHQKEPITAIKEALLCALQEHGQNQQQGDDITFVLLKRL